jgi:hypothetical protein
MGIFFSLLDKIKTKCLWGGKVEETMVRSKRTTFNGRMYTAKSESHQIGCRNA